MRPSGDVSKGTARNMQEKEEEDGYLILGGQAPSLRRRVVVRWTQTRLQPGGLRRGRKATKSKASPGPGGREETESLFKEQTDQSDHNTCPSLAKLIVAGT